MQIQIENVFSFFKQPFNWIARSEKNKLENLVIGKIH